MFHPLSWFLKQNSVQRETGGNESRKQQKDISPSGASTTSIPFMELTLVVLLSATPDDSVGTCIVNDFPKGRDK